MAPRGEITNTAGRQDLVPVVPGQGFAAGSCAGLQVLAAGDATVMLADGSLLAFAGLQAGQYLPTRAIAVMGGATAVLAANFADTPAYSGSEADRRIRGEVEGLAFSGIDLSARVKHTALPTNDFEGDVSDLFEYVAPSVKYVPNEAGIYVPGTTLRTWWEGGAPLGINFEPTRTNLFPNPALQGAVSGTPGVAPVGWTLGNNQGTLTVEARASVIQGLDAITLSVEPGFRQCLSSPTDSVTLTAAFYTISAIVEPIYGDPTGNEILAFRDFASAVAGNRTIDGVVVGSNVPIPPGVHRITLGITPDAGDLTGSVRVGPGVDSPINRPMAVRIHHVQVELGSDASSPIVEGGTRQADHVEFALSRFPFGPNMTLFADFQLRPHNEGNGRIYALNNGSSCFMNRTGILTQVQVFDGEVDGDVVSHNASAPYSTPGKAVTVFSGLNTAACSVLITGRGATPTTGVQDDWQARTSAATHLRIGSQAGATNMNGWLREGMVLPRAMSAIEAQQLGT